MPPSLRRAIVDAIYREGGLLTVVNQMYGRFDNADVLVRWRGKPYRLSAQRLPESVPNERKRDVADT